ncbi:FMN-binding negative transcriptional regulator (plasmid) [Rhizobium leguminosarum bv. trifolii WSM2304]|uniref:FMN-binding negative transcriptional regulator n=1 Tax=Rhizobium leguminosarum bv. trifolii (strain WSM2304) TaxID=395492 RepID=A0ABF7QW01_RHILW|nr:FMN-binding negative transcriptional regulator [Rhizobium leguminosarum]ACI58291.1 FMN-binding negative transcriptional regulator [Rhizobium leguminosarum bv. trifolii WSM2304]
MYTPPAFVVEDKPEIYDMIRHCPLANFITATPAGPMATPLPMILDEKEGSLGVLYGHLARPNPQWESALIGEALAVFLGPDAYVTPSWYPSKVEHGKVVPTWNYTAVQVSGPVEFFHDPDRLLEVVSRLTRHHEGDRTSPWAVTDAPEDFIRAQLRGIVGIRMPISNIAGKRKMSQNRSQADRQGVRVGLMERQRMHDPAVAELVPG